MATATVTFDKSKDNRISVGVHVLCFGILMFPATGSFGFYDTIDATAKVVAAMLEPGTEQHLAHKEGGRWVLNRVPDFREEMAKCRAYYRKGYKTFAVATSASFAFTEMEYNMRAVPLALLSILDKDNNPINAERVQHSLFGCQRVYGGRNIPNRSGVKRQPIGGTYGRI